MSLVNATRSELAKQFSTSMWWVLAIVLLVYIGATAIGLAATFGAMASGALPGASGPALPEPLIPTIIYTTATAMGYVFPLLIGALLVTGEFRHKTLTPTFLATPRRGVALAAKVAAGVIVGVVYALFGLLAAVGGGAAMFVVFGVDTQLGESDMWAMFARMVLAYVLWVLIGIGVGALVRNQVAAVVGVIAFTQFVEPIVRTIGGLVEAVQPVTRFLPGSSSDALVGGSLYTMIAGPGSDTTPWWAGGLVLLGYAVVLLVVGGATSWRRDVT
ncbi:ABC transporter permease [Microbacterium sp. No. 7]|uniref:ABC transporter permease n=1 Tax=Microbacterium sp. No. 7 TaxID=1714373 RepID=UPI0006CF4681|nr:ABC transporter permease [Microbacterium sp. No. 7]ALJ21729.1 hypothetical protein AOA12_18260 [Microbacterium sp. No. 7]